MKRIILSIIAASALLSSFTSCINKSDPAVLWYPVNLMIFVQDQNGNDLLDPEYKYNIISEASLNWEAKEYRPVSEMPVTGEYKLSLLNTSMFGEEDAKNLPKQGYFLNFGEIDGALDMDAIMYLMLPFSPMHEIKYHCGNHIEQTQTCQRYWILDGMETENPFIITLNIPEE